jgi:hypothetical protein
MTSSSHIEQFFSDAMIPENHLPNSLNVTNKKQTNQSLYKKIP